MILTTLNLTERDVRRGRAQGTSTHTIEDSRLRGFTLKIASNKCGQWIVITSQLTAMNAAAVEGTPPGGLIPEAYSRIPNVPP